MSNTRLHHSNAHYEKMRTEDLISVIRFSVGQIHTQIETIVSVAIGGQL